MRKIVSFTLAILILLSFTTTFSLSACAVESSTNLMVVEWHARGRVTRSAIPATDDSGTNPDYKLLSFHWYSTANYYINPTNKYGFNVIAVVATITASADTWDTETAAAVFSYEGTTTRSAGVRDGYNVVSWGTYRRGAIAVTYIWYSGSRIIESDTRMNTYYRWSLSSEPNKMDVQNIMTHEFGHWVGLADLYNSGDYWLTMYGYASYGEIHKRTLGLGDILGLEAVCGS